MTQHVGRRGVAAVRSVDHPMLLPGERLGPDGLRGSSRDAPEHGETRTAYRRVTIGVAVVGQRIAGNGHRLLVTERNLDDWIFQRPAFLHRLDFI